MIWSVVLPRGQVWSKVLRNLDFIASYGRFCLCDDSHGVDQVALNFHQAAVGPNVPDARFPCT
ncbi:Histidinol-phosphatase [Penicillium canescens]|nr:Histidinol-phosphatase [Penicillium canescens]KAJ6175915.1 Histidinol-phosphatase [Penicillium canescens]